MQQNREMILLSARELVAQGGFKDAQIQAIADRAGVSSDWSIVILKIKIRY